MDVEALRDTVVVVAGIVWSIIFLALLGVTVVIYALASRYLGKARWFLHERVRPLFADVQARAEDIRVRTASLPGQPRPPGVLTVTSGTRRAAPAFPFFRRRRKWWQRLLPS